MSFLSLNLLMAAGFVAGILVCFELGRRIGRWALAAGPDGLAKGVGPAEGAVFALLGLIIAFMFSGAAARFEARHHLVTQEANAIGTAWLRLDLLPADAQPGLREAFRRYTELRAVAYQDAHDDALTRQRQSEGDALQAAIWRDAVAAATRPGQPPSVASLMLPALNDMIDITTTRLMAARNHPPAVILLLLAGLIAVGAMLFGYSTADSRQRSWFHVLAFACIQALAVFVILDMEFPRLGLIRIDGSDQVLLDLAASMRQPALTR
ncbi:MAG: DUF4239 domain-containing protein [Betaproteobacteria bacterium]|nr:DUF4239 domain-containing protein [Betaproteobacteria bacterium]